MVKEDRYRSAKPAVPAAEASRPVNLFRTVKGRHAPAVLDRLDAVQVEVEAQEERRARDSASSERFRQCLRALCLDLYDAHFSDPQMLVGVWRDNSALTGNPALPAFVAARPFVDALDGLIATGYVEQVRLGSEASGKSTRVRATQKLREKLTIGDFSVRELAVTSDTIQLKIGKWGSPKKRIRFDDTADTVRWRNNLSLINANNARYRIRLEVSHSDRLAMEAHRWAKAQLKAKNYRAYEYERVNENRNQLHRVFSKADWSEGGRFYGAWWQAVPSAYRKHITINGKPTREYDYSAVQLRILYADMGHDFPDVGDPYSQPYGEGFREEVKACFNLMLNLKKRPKPGTVPTFSPDRMGMSWEEFVDGIIVHHSPIASAFRLGIGGRLQRRDADIAEQVMLKFVQMRQPCLPIHDSFITYATLADELPAIMAAAAGEVVGRAIPSKPGDEAIYSGPTGPVTADISDILDELNRSGLAGD